MNVAVQVRSRHAAYSSMVARHAPATIVAIRVLEKAQVIANVITSDIVIIPDKSLVCRACQRPLDGFEIIDPLDSIVRGSAGYYIDWFEQGRVCDCCMWNDPRYIALYGKPNVTGCDNG